MDKMFNSKEAYVYATLSTISIKTDTMDCTNNALIAVTAAGTIKGTYVSETIQETLKEDTNFLFFNNIDVIAKENSTEPPNSILLKDVTLISGNGIKTRFNYLFVFIDDIIALSFGDLQQN